MNKKKIEIVIPVYNEEKELAKNISILYDFCSKNLTKYEWHITIADNASIDKTKQISLQLAKKLPNLGYEYLSKKGRGRAVKYVWQNTNADYYAYMDVDLSSDLKHLPTLFKALEDGFDIAVGSRLKKGAFVEGRTFIRELTSRTLNILFIKIFFNTNFTDAQCGFKAVSKQVVTELIPHIKDNEWFFDGELLIVGEKSGYTIYEEPIHWVDNPGSTVRLVSTIWGDIQVILRLLKTRPWNKLRKK